MKTKALLLAGFLMLGTAWAVGQTNATTDDQSGQAATPTAVQSNSGGQQSAPASPANNPTAVTAQPADTGNAGLQSRINDALRNEPTLGASHVTANVSNSGIDLSGTVGSAKDKQTAERIASSFDGNRKITDSIVVTGAGHSDLDPKHSALNNGGVGNVPNPAMNNGASNPQK
jgi:hypothetical protein